ncbi:hypothetical protein ACIQNU_31005 [Streptomyces sp. NPDC091292]|uniref:hypothetical protein n=1 Tax=Streptomyces sp. NPDC091292 TaxID=3365991 RepID=UPI00381A5EBD
MRALPSFRKAVVATGLAVSSVAVVGLSASGAVASSVPPEPFNPFNPSSGQQQGPVLGQGGVLVSNPTLADGKTTAKVYEFGPHHYEADIFIGSTKVGVIIANGHDASAQNTFLRVTLHPNGDLSSSLRR